MDSSSTATDPTPPTASRSPPPPAHSGRVATGRVATVARPPPRDGWATATSTVAPTPALLRLAADAECDGSLNVSTDDRTLSRAFLQDERAVFGYGAVVMVLCALPAIWLCAVLANMAVDEWRDEGVDVRYPDEAPSGSIMWLARAPHLIANPAIFTLVALSAHFLVLNSGYAATGALLRAECGMAIPIIALNLSAYMGGTPLLRTVATLLVLVAVAVLGFRGVGTILGRRTGFLFVAQWAWLVGIASINSYAVVEWFVAPTTTDGQRVLWRVLVQPTIVELGLAPMRFVARLHPGHKVHWSMVAIFFILVTSTLMGRLEMVSMRTGWGQVTVVLGVAVAETLLRVTTLHRDAFYAAVFMRSRTQGRAVARTVASKKMVANVLVLEHLSELWATLVMALFVAFFRVGYERQAPTGRSIVLSTALQLVAEVAVDALPLVVLALCTYWRALGVAALRRFTDVVRQRMLHRNAALAAWDWRWKALLLFTTWAAVFRFGTFYAMGKRDDVVYCSWSEQQGAWHRVPCAQAGEWLSSA